ncbi:caspase-8-like [Mizuhopecten yessoensis]|uniref:caspase-8-like n=1 Tax=Mizuhopecten yessoensis TaxID=6573 RepID=UPI000B45C042|nr:caspase-8-like [Mizuhopecten yessoensis]
MVGYKPEIDDTTCTDTHFNETKSATQGEYPMTRNPRGYAVIFNMETFYKVPGDPTSIKLENRQGSSKDAEGLQDAFEKLRFIVDRHDDKTIADITTITDGYASRDHSSFDCFVFCILTHGSEGKLYDANGHSFQFESIFKRLHARKCSTLGGKPKLFFLQACQGNQSHFGHDLQADIVPLQPGSNTNFREVNTNFLEGNSPNEADFLVFFPTRLGLPAFRDDNQGSWFIQSLVENLKQYGESCPLLDIFTMVIREVSCKRAGDQDGNHYDQTPKFDSSLSKTVFFRPLGAP